MINNRSAVGRCPARAAGSAHVPMANPVGTLWRRMVLWLQWHASVMELQQLRDRELRDIGLSRHEIPAVVAFLLGKTDGARH